MEKENINYKHNYDIIFKWIASVFTGETLDVLGIKTGKITEVRGLEPITIQVKEERVDILLKDENDSYYHIEEERSFSRADLYRFAAQHFLIAEQIKSNDLTTIIIASGTVTPISQIDTKCGSFHPQMINLNERDGEAKLEEMRQQERPNPIELVFLPMYGAKQKSKEDFAKDVVFFAKDLYHQKKLKLEFLGALVILCNKMIPLDILKALWEDIKMLQVFKDVETIVKEQGRLQGRLQEKREIAIEMLKDNVGVKQIVKFTKLTEEEVLEIKKELDGK